MILVTMRILVIIMVLMMVMLITVVTLMVMIITDEGDDGATLTLESKDNKTDTHLPLMLKKRKSQEH